MGIRLEHENYATGVSMREMSTQMGSTGNNGGAEGLPEMQVTVLEHAAPEARQNQGLTSRLADGDYPENRDSVNLGVRIGDLLAQTDKYTARAAYSIAGQLMFEREHKAISSESAPSNFR